MPKQCQAPLCAKNNFGGGFCPSHQYLRPKKEVKEKKDRGLYQRPKEVIEDNKDELNEWFKARRLQLTGKCVNCGAKSCRDDDNYYKFSIAHIFGKALFKSVATHPLNFLELCFWGESSCHSNLDNGMIDLIDMNCWDEIVTKVNLIYPDIAPKERRRIPQVLLNYLNT